MALSLRERVAAKKASIAADNTRQQRAYKFPVGKTLIRLFPDADPAKDPWRDFGQHWIKDLTGKTLAAVGDRSIAYGEEDVIRNAIFSAAQANPSLKDHLFKECLARKRILTTGVVLGKAVSNAGKTTLVVDEAAKPDEPQLFDWSTTGFDEILSVLEIYIDNDEDVFDLATGMTILVERTGTTATDTKYTFNAFPKKYPVPQAVFDKKLDLDKHIADTFASNEARALTALSTILGRPITSIGSAVGATAAGALTDGRTGTTGAANDTGMATSFVEGETVTAPFGNSDEDLSGIVVEDAVFEEAPAVEPVKPSAASTTTTIDMDDADLAGLLDGIAEAA
jgi:hypothetical protein